MCLACQKETPENTIEITDHFLSQENFRVTFCATCQLGRTNMDSNKDLAQYYASDEYISHGTTKAGLFEQLYQTARKFTLRQKSRIIGANTGTRLDILDYGCGTGDFLAFLKNRGHSVYGVEPGAKPRKITEHKIGHTAYSSLREILPDQKFDIITLWHVLEHVANPLQTLEELTALLKPQGQLIVAVPNHKSEDCRYYKSQWAGYDVPRHLWHFSQTALQKIAAQTPLQQNKVLPMKLDAFYVSLLSEKYKGRSGLTQWVNGFITGLRSNLKARQTGEWSSLIYTFTK